MIRSETQPDLTDWIKQPIHCGSVYIKPTKNKRTCSEVLYIYLHYIFCCKYIEVI